MRAGSEKPGKAFAMDFNNIPVHHHHHHHHRHHLHSPPLLIPGLPDEIATLCLARVPSLSLLWMVSPSWRSLICTSSFFHSFRASLGFRPHNWFYALIHSKDSTPSPSSSSPTAAVAAAPSVSPSSTTTIRRPFSWHAFDPLSSAWISLPPLPGYVDFQLTSPNFIGLFHTVQCVSSSTKLFMVAGSSRGGHRSGAWETREANGRDARRPLEPALDRPLIFDTRTWDWSLGSPFLVPRRWCACGIVSDKHLLVASGCGREWDLALSKSAEMYDPDLCHWVLLDGLKSSKFSGEAITAVDFNGKLHMVSGQGVGVLYDPGTGKWVDLPKGMRNGWNGPSVVVDGKLLVLEEAVGRLKCYDEVEDCWNSVMEDEMLMDMDQLTGGRAPGMFCGILRAPANYEAFPGQEEKVGGPGSPPRHRDVFRIVNIRSKPPFIKDVRVPFGEIVSLQVLSRTSVGG